MKTFRIGMIIGLAVLAMTSCKKGGVFCNKGNGNIVTEERALTGFDEVSLEISADLYIEQGTEYSVKLETSENLLGLIETKVKGSTLLITTKNGKCIKNQGILKVHIVLPTLRGVDISGSGDVIVRNEMITDRMDVNISGSGKLEFDTLNVADLDVNISGSGDLFVLGTDTAQTQKINISGSGEVHAVQMPVKHSNIKISGSGECEVFVTETLVVLISGSGDVRYKGGATVEGTSTGSGTIKPY